MNSTVGTNHIICCACGLRFERTKEFRHCSNCFACTGCEIYYCPQCNNEIVITQVKQMIVDPKPEKVQDRTGKSGRI